MKRNLLEVVQSPNFVTVRPVSHPKNMIESLPLPLPSQMLHDLRTPVHQIVGYVEMLQENANEDGNEILASDLGKVKIAAADLQKMLEERFVATRGNAAPGDAATAHMSHASAQQTTKITPIAIDEDDKMLSSGAECGLLLVVDDNETNRDVLSRRLQMQGYLTDTAADGIAALAAVEEREFDMVLLDIMMPDMDGYEVLRRLKDAEKTRDLPVIMISALGDLDSVARCIEMGAEDYLPKPFNPTLLKARVGACLEKKRGRDREARLFAQLQQNYERLQQLEKMRDDLTSMVVHDLRTPLSSVMAGLQTMPMLGKLSPEQQECCDIALRGGSSLLDIINDLLDISKIEAGASDLEIAAVDIAELIGTSLEQVQGAAARQELVLQREIAPDLPAFMGDEGKLRRTLVNLLGNAIKFSPSGAQIIVGARIEKRELWLLVRDHGEGIPRDAFDRIFEKFGQVEDRKAGRVMSTGLGLALCKMVADAHGGRIWVESELGKGSTFTLALPL